MAKLTGKPNGRPPIPYNPEIGDRICEILATTTLGLEAALEDVNETFATEELVGLTTIYKWLRANEEFSKQYASAREHQAQILHDRAQQEAENFRPAVLSKKGKRGDKDFEETATSDNYNRSRLIVDTMLKRAGQLNPKKYSEKLAVVGDADQPLKLVIEHIGQPQPKAAEKGKK
jgi:hypothetical protein